MSISTTKLFTLVVEVEIYLMIHLAQLPSGSWRIGFGVVGRGFNSYPRQIYLRTTVEVYIEARVICKYG